MRVLETEVAVTYSMGKKNKHKLRKNKENEASDSSEEVSGRGCTHVNKAVSFSTMRKGLAKQTFGECAGCAKEASTKKVDRSLEVPEGATGFDFHEEVEPTLWVCLQCGNQGCDRNSQEKHALKHYETPRSSSHCVVINTTTWSAWCYDCDDEVLAERYKKVAECLEHIKKIACVPTPDSAQGRNGSGSSGASSSVDCGARGRPQTPKGASSVCQKVKGLSNLGNTCFFNAVLQNLIQTYSLDHLLGERKKGKPLMLAVSEYLDLDSGSSSDDGDETKSFNKLPSIEISLTEPGQLTQSLVVFLHEMNSQSRSNILNPSALFGQICKKASRFKGFQQQDSHELLRYLLDNMRTEEIKRGQSGILKHFKLTENTNPKKVEDDVKRKVKAYGRLAKHTFVECLFGGQLISTVVCEECKHISQVLEPFLDLSLPVTEEKPQRPNQMYGARRKEGRESLSESKDETQLKKEDGWHMKEKDEKPSKHQTKKQRRQSKKEAKKSMSRNKVAPAASEREKVDGVEQTEKTGNEEEEKEEDQGEEAKEGEEEDEERCDASDADVEDNLESDTSRCYRNLDDSSILNSESLAEVQVEMSEDQSISAVSNESHDNHVLSLPSVAAGSNDPMDHSASSGIAESGTCTGNSVTGEEISVSYTVSLESPVTGESQLTADVSVTAPDVQVTVVYPQASDGMVNGDSSHQQQEVNGMLPEGCDNKTDHYCCKASKSAPITNVAMETVVNGNGLLYSDSGSEKHAGGGDELKTCVSESVAGASGDQSIMDSGIHSMTLSDKQSIDSSLSLSHDMSRLTLNGAGEKQAMQNSCAFSSSQKSVCANGTADNSIPVSSSTAVETSTPPCQPLSPTTRKHRSWKEVLRDAKRKSLNPVADRYHPTSGECSIESCLHQFTSAELLTGNNKFGCKNCTKRKQNPNKEKKEIVYTNASKQFLIFEPPAVLTLHLKRFEQIGFSSRKVNRHVEFPFTLDLAPYCSSLCQSVKSGQKKILYSLYGVVEHSGRLSSGHYTAYVKVRPNMATLTNFLNFKHVTVREYLHKYAQREMSREQDHLEHECGADAATDALIPPGRWYHISDTRVNEVTEASVERAQAYLLFYERVY